MEFSPPPPCLDTDPLDPTPLTSDEIAHIAKALGHHTRIEVLEYFRECRPLNVGEIAAHLPLAQSTVSEHLRILRSADLLCTSEDGPRTWHCLHRAVLRRFARDIETLTVRPDAADDPQRDRVAIALND